MGERRVDDNSFMGSSRKNEMPDGVHVKRYAQADTAGNVSDYADTSEEILSMQNKSAKILKGFGPKSGYRN